MFENHSIVIDDRELKRYSKNWHKPAVSYKYSGIEEHTVKAFDNYLKRH